MKKVDANGLADTDVEAFKQACEAIERLVPKDAPTTISRGSENDAIKIARELRAEARDKKVSAATGAQPVEHVYRHVKEYSYSGRPPMGGWATQEFIDYLNRATFSWRTEVAVVLRKTPKRIFIENKFETYTTDGGTLVSKTYALDRQDLERNRKTRHGWTMDPHPPADGVESAPAWATVLDLEMPTTIADVKRAYRRKAKTAHPDAGGSPEDFRRVTDAFKAAERHFRRFRMTTRDSIVAFARDVLGIELTAHQRELLAAGPKNVGVGADIGEGEVALLRRIANGAVSWSEVKATPIELWNDLEAWRKVRGDATAPCSAETPDVGASLRGLAIRWLGTNGIFSPPRVATLVILLERVCREAPRHVMIAPSSGASVGATSEAPPIGVGDCVAADSFICERNDCPIHAAARLTEPLIHSHIDDGLPAGHPLAFEQVHCASCSTLVHAFNNECMTTWLEFVNANVCAACVGTLAPVLGIEWWLDCARPRSPSEAALRKVAAYVDEWARGGDPLHALGHIQTLVGPPPETETQPAGEAT